MTNYGRHFSTRRTPQSEPIPGSSQVPNSAGGYAWSVSDWDRLDRFLVLGSQGGSYYASERDLTVENAQAVARCLRQDGRRTVDRIVEISEAGRAPKNDPALFALAMASGMGDMDTRRYALSNLTKVARIPTHNFYFLEQVKQFRGWGRALRRAEANWYLEKDPERLAYLVAKYQQRHGWSHRDVLRQAHPTPPNAAYNHIFKWVIDGTVPPLEAEFKPILGLEAAKLATTKAQVIRAITDLGLTWEMVPSKWLKEAEVWEALMQAGMPTHALIRNLGRMTANGALAPMSARSLEVATRLTDQGQLRRARVHPLNVLIALNTYRSGSGARGSLAWSPVPQIVDALDAAFYMTFDLIEPANKRTLIGLDVSASMDWDTIAGMPGITPRVGAAAMAMATIRTEPLYYTYAFTRQFIPLTLTANMALSEVVGATSLLRHGGTDCSLPMIFAADNGIEVDTFVVYTDSETWGGRRMHPSQALVRYREKMGIPAKLVVVGMLSNGFSIADPDDAGMMDVVGFDTAAPNLIASFSRGSWV